MKSNRKKITQTKKKKIEKLEYRIFIGLMISYVLYFMFFEPFFIGHDVRYRIYIFLLPVLLGLFSLGYYYRKSIHDNILKSESLKNRILVIVFYLFQGVLISYISFGQLAKITWDILCYQAVKQNVEVIYACKVTNFTSIRNSNKIHFMFKGKDESVSVDYDFIKEFIDKNPKRYQLKIKVRKGIWNYYYVEDWEISN